MAHSPSPRLPTPIGTPATRTAAVRSPSPRRTPTVTTVALPAEVRAALSGDRQDVAHVPRDCIHDPRAVPLPEPPSPRPGARPRPAPSAFRSRRPRGRRVPVPARRRPRARSGPSRGRLSKIRRSGIQPTLKPLSCRSAGSEVGPLSSRTIRSEQVRCQLADRSTTSSYEVDCIAGGSQGDDHLADLLVSFEVLVRLDGSSKGKGARDLRLERTIGQVVMNVRLHRLPVGRVT